MILKTLINCKVSKRVSLVIFKKLLLRNIKGPNKNPLSCIKRLLLK